jgi:hypothetical protein
VASSVPANITALLALVQGAAEFADAFVDFGMPLELPKQAERVLVLDETDYIRGDAEQIPQETYALQVVVEVFKPSPSTAIGAVTRRWELYDALEALLLADDFEGMRTDGGDLVVVGSVTVPFDKGWVSTCTVQVPVLHRGE